MKIRITNEEIDTIGVVRAGVGDGYWEDMARTQIRDVYIRGMIDALKSIRASYGAPGSALSRSIKRRLAYLEKELAPPEAPKEEKETV